MKKAIIALTAVLMTVFIVTLVLNAQDDPKSNKTTTCVKKDCTKGPHASPCCSMKYGSTPAKECPSAGCQSKDCSKCTCKEGKCNNGPCKTSDAGKCDPLKCDKQCPQRGTN